MPTQERARALRCDEDLVLPPNLLLTTMALSHWLIFVHNQYKLSYTEDSGPSYEDAIKLCEETFDIANKKIKFEVDIIDVKGNPHEVLVTEKNWNKYVKSPDVESPEVVILKVSIVHTQNSPGMSFTIIPRKKLVDLPH